jgi:hypothetical protein
MRLILSSRHPRNSAYSTEDGHVLYKISQPRRLDFAVATIQKAVKTVNGVWTGDFGFNLGMNSTLLDVEARERDELDKDERYSMNSQDDPFSSQDSGDDEPEPSTDEEIPAAEGHFAFYAQVEFHTFTSSRFRYNCLDIPVREFFRKEGWSWFGR